MMRLRLVGEVKYAIGTVRRVIGPDLGVQEGVPDGWFIS
jgi:hypothetical protein